MTEEIKKLSDYSHARLRTEMYLGSRAPHTQTILDLSDLTPKAKEVTWVPALYTAFREIVDNSLDEIIGYKRGNRIDITYNPETLEFSVEDNGRGIPIDYDTNERMHKATMVMTHARAGRNFGDRQNVAGTNGIGASIVNFCSEYFHMQIHRDKKKFTQEFHEGNIVVDELHIKKPQIRKVSSTKTGTRIEWKLSKEVFKERILPEDFIKSRVVEIALSNPSLKVFYNGKQIKINKSIEKILFGDFEPIKVEIKEKDFQSTFWLVPDFADQEMVHTVVNNIFAINGGVHIDAFRREFYPGFLAALEPTSKRRKVSPNRSDVSDGLLIFNITQMKAPDFDSQSKTRLINEWVGKTIKKHLTEDVYKEIIRKNKTWIESIYERAYARTNMKEDAEIKKLSRKLKKTKIANLRDATGTDRSKCILFLSEGNSAISEMASVRNPEIHGGLPLRGKVLNVNGVSRKKVLDNSTLADIMNAIGLTLAERANRYKLRYSKVYIAADMDPDGANITSLLINFFYTYWPELFDPNNEPFFYIFITPFIIAEKGKQRKYWYNYNYKDFKPEEWKGWAITRAKGLGTLTKDDWKHCLDKPELYPVVDDGKMKDALDLIFGADTDKRKEWIGL